jgi:YD repeat-containing protein
MSHPLNDVTLYKGSSAYYPSVTETIYSGPVPSGETVYYYSPSDVEGGPWNYVIPSNEFQLNMPEFYTNQGVKESRTAGQPYKIVEYSGSRLAGTKVRETTNSHTNFKAPPSSPKRYSYFGGVKGLLIGQYTGSFRLCVGTPVVGASGAGLVYECSTIATVVNMDPLGYLYKGPEVEGNYYPGKYYGSTVELSTLSNVYKLSKTVTTNYNFSGIHPMVNTTNYYYDNIMHMQPTRIASFNSNGDTTTTRTKYALDFPNNDIAGVELLRAANRISDPVEQLSMVKVGSANQVAGGLKNTFKSGGGGVLNDKTYKLNTGGKFIPLTNYSETYAGYELENSYDFYDETGNLTLYSTLNSPKTAVLWGYNQQYPIAKVVNVPYIYDVAYTNFESENKDHLKGFWTYSGIPAIDATCPSGDNVYPLAGKPITKALYTMGKKYILSYWYKIGSVITVSGGTVGAEVKKNVKGNWIFVEREISPTATVTLSGTGFIDELGFYPADGQLTTYSYNVGVGLTRSQDPKGQFTTYEYDNEQRVKYIRDQQGNIVKAYDYNIGSRYK